MTKTLLPRLDVLDQLVVGSPLRHGAVTVMPVFSPTRIPSDDGPDYRLAADAFADRSLEIHEATSSGVVGMLEARNRGRARVLIVEGDHLIGAKQNRMLTSSALLGANRRVNVPASCVEQGRWRGPSAQFATLATMVPASLRRIAKLSVTQSVIAHGERAADQQRIWSTIADQQRHLQVSSATRALAHTFAERSHEIEDAAIRLPHAAGAVGLAIGIAGELISLDVFDREATCVHYWRRIVEGAVLEGLSARGRTSAPLDATAVRSLLQMSCAGTWVAVPPVGDGHEHRARLGDAAGSLLGLDGRLVHFGVVTGVALDSPRTMTRRGYVELPDALARHYRIVERIGVGGTKEVFRAARLDKPGEPDVAIARIPFVDEHTFGAEISVVRRIESNYVPRIHESFIDEHGDGYIVMERCDGPNLATILAQRGGPLPVADAAPILLAFARGLREVHDAHVLHRDIKLENVMLAQTPAGDVALKIVDFGISARASCAATAVGQIRFGGTLPYMSREVLRGFDLDARTDVYAFGVCCFRLLAGDFPAPPKEHEAEFEYMQRLAHLERHDFSRLPPLPTPVTGILQRMLDTDREHRPLMPEVVDVFERAFADSPPLLRMPPAAPPARTRPPALALESVARIRTPVASPEHVIVAPCMQAPIIVLAPADTSTLITAYRLDGTVRWSRRIDGRFTAGLRADLDGDGMRELYLAGPGRVAVLGASGSFKLAREVPIYAAQPTLLAIVDTAMPRLAIDGRLIEPSTGRDLGTLANAYQGDGRELVATEDRRGIAFNGFALQSFRGTHETAAAIVLHHGDPGFLVAHLEEARRGGMPRIDLSVYGPGGSCRLALPIAGCEPNTGDMREIHRLQTTPLFTSTCSPLAVLGPDRTAAVIVPLLSPDPAIPRTLAAFELPSGRQLWRVSSPTQIHLRGQLASLRTPAPGVHVIDARPRAILADVDGDGRPELVVGDGTQLVAYDPWTGATTEPLACTGVPIAFGDPFASGFAHLVVAAHDGIELFRGPAWTPGSMQWTGPRGDLWRTGTLRADGQPLGPL